MYSRPPSRSDLELDRGLCCHPFLFAIYLDDIPILRSLLPRSFIVLYADDILLIAPSVSELQELFDACAIELSWLDMNINEKVLLYPH